MGAMSSPAVRERVTILSSTYRVATVGILLVITLAAFEAMAVATAMPRLMRSLDGLEYYGWAFTGFLVPNIIGVVAGGEICDREGPKRPLVGGMAIFTAGLLVAGFAPHVFVFLIGRAVQGIGSGLVIVAVYLVIAEVYPPELRPKMFAGISAAWVLPALIGPVVSGALTEHVSWRVVFLLIAPFVAIGFVMVLPSIRQLPQHVPGERQVRRWPFAVILALGVVAMQYAGQHLRLLSILPLVVGLALLIMAMPRLVPAGTFLVRRGIPAVVMCRGLVACAFFAVDSYVPLTLTELHGYGPTAAGVPLMLGALGWSFGSWRQGRAQGDTRFRLARTGFSLIALVASAMALLAVPGQPGWIAYLIWPIAGAGIGMVMTLLSVLLLEYSEPAERGRNSSALQIFDITASAITVGLGGVLVAAAENGLMPLRSSIAAINLGMAVVAILGVLAAGRLVLRR